MDNAVNLLFEVYKLRGECCRTATRLTPLPTHEAQLEDCARLDDALARMYRSLQRTLKDIRRSQARRVRRKR